MMNLLEINQRIKQRPPFQMIERVTELVPNESAKGIKCVSVNEPYFMGHFPETPIMPGVLLIESAAQLCSLVIAPDAAASDENKLYVLLKVKAPGYPRRQTGNIGKGHYGSRRSVRILCGNIRRRSCQGEGQHAFHLDG